MKNHDRTIKSRNLKMFILSLHAMEIIKHDVICIQITNIVLLHTILKDILFETRIVEHIFHKLHTINFLYNLQSCHKLAKLWVSALIHFAQFWHETGLRNLFIAICRQYWSKKILLVKQAMNKTLILDHFSFYIILYNLLQVKQYFSLLIILINVLLSRV